jgi:ankyrin repeat protein
VKQELCDAAAAGDETSVARLLTAGADVDAKDRYGQTALMLAATHGHDGVVGILLAHGADTDVTAKYGLSALMLAVVNRHAKTARQLVDAGSELSLKGSGAPGFAGKTALDLAEHAGMTEIAEYISAAG